jgi:hypothetical protein
MNTNQTYPRRSGIFDRTYKRKPSPEELVEMQNYSEKKIVENVYLVKYITFETEMLVHHCEGNQHYKEMTFRESEDGPMYWCEGCGYTLDSGTAMAVRLYEAPIA